jgi:uncharacterized protein (TIGR02646 family)
MKYIQKHISREPRKLREFRESTPNASYNGLHGTVKDEIRNTLCIEQGYICAYCMGRITPTPAGMEIEHYIPQVKISGSPFSEEEHKSGQLKYLNMLGTCNGIRSCSNIRGNRILKSNPMHPSCENLIKYRKDGFVYSDDQGIQNDINILNLNQLTEARRVVIDKAREEFISKSPQKLWTNVMIHNEISRWKSPKQTRHGIAFEEYCMAAVQYLESKLK